MKTFKDVETTISNNGTGHLKYSDLAIMCLSYVNPQVGIQGDAMYKNFKIIDKIEAGVPSKEISLEDAEYDILVAKIQAMPWGMQHRDIVAFTEAVKAVKENK